MLICCDGELILLFRRIDTVEQEVLSRYRDLGPREPHRQRRHQLAVRVEGAEQVAPPPLVTAIRSHRSATNRQFRASEANTSVDVFNSFSEGTKQNLLNFLRSL
jgi:hypothetical protein